MSREGVEGCWDGNKGCSMGCSCEASVRVQACYNPPMWHFHITHEGLRDPLNLCHCGDRKVSVMLVPFSQCVILICHYVKPRHM
jgi:hypothetical protein